MRQIAEIVDLSAYRLKIATTFASVPPSDAGDIFLRPERVETIETIGSVQAGLVVAHLHMMSGDIHSFEMTPDQLTLLRQKCGFLDQK